MRAWFVAMLVGHPDASPPPRTRRRRAPRCKAVPGVRRHRHRSPARATSTRSTIPATRVDLSARRSRGMFEIDDGRDRGRSRHEARVSRSQRAFELLIAYAQQRQRLRRATSASTRPIQFKLADTATRSGRRRRGRRPTFAAGREEGCARDCTRARRRSPLHGQPSTEANALNA